jgi:hypothetical protein
MEQFIDQGGTMSSNVSNDAEPTTNNPKILIVADGGVSFNFLPDGLSIFSFIKVLERRFTVRTVRRESLPFTFENLRNFHELWLFGHAARFADAPRGRELQKDELAAVAKFMNAGGGVFATGDHEDLGIEMCNGIPRVRSMRRWFWKQNPGPSDPPMAPSRDGSDRHDTLRPSKTGRYLHENQEDENPQQITPRLFASTAGVTAVHPIFARPGNRTINILPDHTHEGNCVKPSTLTNTYDFGSVKGDDYPMGAGGRLSPEILADETTIGGHTTIEGKEYPQVSSTSFGAMCAYDGSRLPAESRVGRVVTEATWHHFMDVNLKGFPPSTEYRQIIETYYLNIAFWLLPPAAQRELITTGFRAALERYPLAELFPSGDPSDVRNAAGVGAMTRACLDELEPHVVATLLGEAGLDSINPFAVADVTPPETNPFFDPNIAVDVAVGGAMLQFVNASSSDTAAGDLADEAIKGAQVALNALPLALASSASAFTTLLAAQ